MIWLITTPMGRALAGAVAVLALLCTVWWQGGKAERDAAAARAARDYQTTTEAMQNAGNDDLDDAGILDWLRKRGK